MIASNKDKFRTIAVLNATVIQNVISLFVITLHRKLTEKDVEKGKVQQQPVRFKIADDDEDESSSLMKPPPQILIESPSSSKISGNAPANV